MIRSKTARMMLTFRHFEFKQRLRWKAWQRGALVLDVNEAYHQQDPQLGRYREHQDWAAPRQFGMSHGFGMDRDVNGARGIFLRALGDSPFLRGLLTQVASQTTTGSVELLFSVYLSVTQQSAGSCGNWNGSA